MSLWAIFDQAEARGSGLADWADELAARPSMAHVPGKCMAKGRQRSLRAISRIPIEGHCGYRWAAGYTIVFGLDLGHICSSYSRRDIDTRSQLFLISRDYSLACIGVKSQRWAVQHYFCFTTTSVMSSYTFCSPMNAFTSAITESRTSLAVPCQCLPTTWHNRSNP